MPQVRLENRPQATGPSPQQFEKRLITRRQLLLWSIEMLRYLAGRVKALVERRFIGPGPQQGGRHQMQRRPRAVSAKEDRLPARTSQQPPERLPQKTGLQTNILTTIVLMRHPQILSGEIGEPLFV
ncbi:MAG: hypothetical protein HC834_05450 [Rhodospirillales bacterium]|nr:hypothetical protein [Rhodospirillales bacterium]